MELSIIIVNWNKAALTEECIASVREHTVAIPYEIIVVDNGSSPAEYELISGVCNAFDVDLISLNNNLYFGEANNIAAEISRGRMLLFLNNDVVLTPQYLEPLIRTLDQAFCAGAVGPKFIYPNGQLQEAGAYIRADGWTIRHGNDGSPADLIATSGPHIVDYCSAACLLMRRDVFLSAGGFDPLFDPAYFEDVDLMLRLRSVGLYTYLCTDVTVIHDENTTSKAVWGNDRHLAVVADGHKKFVKRWGEYLGRRLFANAPLPHFKRICWTPAPQASPDLSVVALCGPGLISQNQPWVEIILLASSLSSRCHIVLAADEACSRCRILTLASKLEVCMGSFSIARSSEIQLSHADTMIVFREDIDGSISIASSRGPCVEQVQTELERMRQNTHCMIDLLSGG